MLPVAINLILALCSASVNGWKVLEHHFTSVVRTDSPHHFLVALNYFSISLLCFTTVEKKNNRSQVTYKCSYKLSHFADPTSISTSSIDQIDHCISFDLLSPLKEKEVDVVVALGQKVAQHTGGVTTTDLIGWQTEVNALHEVPQLGHCVLAETPERVHTSKVLLLY